MQRTSFSRPSAAFQRENWCQEIVEEDNSDSSSKWAQNTCSNIGDESHWCKQTNMPKSIYRPQKGEQAKPHLSSLERWKGKQYMSPMGRWNCRTTPGYHPWVGEQAEQQNNVHRPYPEATQSREAQSGLTYITRKNYQAWHTSQGSTIRPNTHHKEASNKGKGNETKEKQVETGKKTWNFQQDQTEQGKPAPCRIRNLFQRLQA